MEWQAVILGLAAGSVIYVGVFVWAMRRPPSFDAASSRSGAFSHDMAPPAVIARLKEAAPVMGLKLALEDDANHRLVLSEGMSLFSFGNFILVDATADGPGSKVTVGLKPRVPQWGPAVTSRHRAVLTKIKAALGAAG